MIPITPLQTGRVIASKIITMTEFTHPIIDRVAALNFPNPAGVIITHSSALAARGMDLGRPLGDIDLVVTKDNQDYARYVLGFHAIKQERYYQEDLPENIRSTISPDGEFDVYSHDFIPKLFRKHGRGRVYPEKLISLLDPRYDQDERTNLWVASFRFVEMTQDGTGRPKDADTLRRQAQHHEHGY